MELKTFRATDRYNVDDLMRVEHNCQLLRDRIAALLGVNLQLDIRTDWDLTSLPTIGQMDRIRCNIEQLARTMRDAYTIPDFGDYFDYTIANQFERAFEFMDQYLADLIAIISQPLAGQYFANEPLFLPAERRD